MPEEEIVSQALLCSGPTPGCQGIDVRVAVTGPVIPGLSDPEGGTCEEGRSEGVSVRLRAEGPLWSKMRHGRLDRYDHF